MITIYGRDTSSNVQPVVWAAAEIGLAFDRLDYGGVHGKTDTPEYRAMQPMGLVPALRDGDLTVFESCAILRYLAGRYGDGGSFWPADPVARARIDQWAEWAKLNFVNAFTGPIFWPKVRTPAARRDETALAAAVETFESRIDLLAAQIGDGGHVCGEDFTLADVVVGSVLYRWFTLDLPRRPRPAFEAYYRRLAARPAYARHVMVSYDGLRVEGA